MPSTDRAADRTRAAELFATVLLSLAGVATSWSSYQAALWGGIQAMHYSRASTNRVEATREFTAAGQVESIDVSLFMSWTSAYAGGNEALQKFYRVRFRKEFQPAFEEWLATQPARNPAAEPTPFTLRSYRIAHRDSGTALEKAAEQEFRDGQDANDASDKYVLNSVVLAMVLFFAGIAQQFRITAVRFSLLAISALLLAGGSFNLFLLPRA